MITQNYATVPYLFIVIILSRTHTWLSKSSFVEYEVHCTCHVQARSVDFYIYVVILFLPRYWSFSWIFHAYVMLRYCKFSWTFHSCVMLSYCKFSWTFHSCLIPRYWKFSWTFHAYVMLRYCKFSWPVSSLELSTHASCYATVSFLNLPCVRHATLL